MRTILLGVLLNLFNFRLFSEDVEVVLGMFAFMAGYVGVLAGCGWWLKAKAWPEALLIIGALPIFILLIAYVRLIFVYSPLLLPFGMVMMPIVLVTVIFTLPDRSGI